eukprot:scaffold46445_cov59-Phaeocystis_antarctica.AAC.5
MRTDSREAGVRRMGTDSLEPVKQDGPAPHAAHLVVLEGFQVVQLPQSRPHPEHCPGKDSPRGRRGGRGRRDGRGWSPRSAVRMPPWGGDLPPNTYTVGGWLGATATRNQGAQP